MTDPINPDHYRRFPVEVIEQIKAAAWDEGEWAGSANQANWDGWRYTKPEITNPYRKQATNA